MAKGPFVENDTVENHVERINHELRDVSNIEFHSIIQNLGWKRPWRWVPGFWTKENWLFQFYHIVYVIIVFWPFLFWADKWYGWAIASLIFAVGREWEQWKNWDWKVYMWSDRVMDVLGHILGGQMMFWAYKYFTG